MSIEHQSDINLVLIHRDALLRLHYEGCSYGKAFPDKSDRRRLKKYGIVFHPEDTAKWCAVLTPFTKEVLEVE